MTRDMLKDLGLEKDAIDKIMDDYGKGIEKAKTDAKGLQEQLDAKESTIAELNETIKGFEATDDTVKALQDKVNAYEQAEKERKKAEKDAEQDKILTDNILEIIGDKEFVNDYTKNSIIAQIKTELAKAENKGKGTKDIFESLTNDVEGIFKNPQEQKLEIPPTGNPNQDDVDEAFVRQVMGLPSK